MSDLAVAARLPSPLDPASAEAAAAAANRGGTTPSLPPSHSQPLTRIIAACVDKRAIHIVDYHRREKTGSFHVDHDMTCLSLSRDGEEMLLNMSCGEVWTIDVNSQDVRKKFRGQKQGKYVIRSCYGGASEGFVLSGGEGQSSNCPDCDSPFSQAPHGRLVSHVLTLLTGQMAEYAYGIDIVGSSSRSSKPMKGHASMP